MCAILGRASPTCATSLTCSSQDGSGGGPVAAVSQKAMALHETWVSAKKAMPALRKAIKPQIESHGSRIKEEINAFTDEVPAIDREGCGPYEGGCLPYEGRAPAILGSSPRCRSSATARSSSRSRCSSTRRARTTRTRSWT
eukprot:5350462-Prymnesium_polylepis.1